MINIYETKFWALLTATSHIIPTAQNSYKSVFIQRVRKIKAVSNVHKCEWHNSIRVSAITKLNYWCMKRSTFALKQAKRAQRGSRCISSALPLASAVDRGVGRVVNATPRSLTFIPGRETRYPLYRGLGGPQGRSGRERKISPPQGFDPRTDQPVASRYTDWAIDALNDTYWQSLDLERQQNRSTAKRHFSVFTVEVVWAEGMLS